MFLALGVVGVALLAIAVAMINRSHGGGRLEGEDWRDDVPPGWRI